MSEPFANVERDVMRRLELALEAARAAGGVTLQFFQGDQLGTVTKGDGSPVTEADKGAERVLREAIGEAFPDDAILGEEYGEAAGGSGYRWILDPIDGTVSFVHGVPLYGTLVGVYKGDEPVVGVVHMPALSETVYAARQGGAWWISGPGRDARPAFLTETRDIADALLVTTALEYFDPETGEDVYARLADACKRMRGWSDCYAHVLLATGRCDAVVEPTIKPWDISPMACILAELGGHLTDWQGVPRLDGGDAVLTNAHLKDAVLGVLGRAARA
ncbi:MAG: hypothetical protein HRU13_05095 [Phycisphaerales bacterium]|nr:hypothetical protein [Phycisphaerales bacterium]